MDDIIRDAAAPIGRALTALHGMTDQRWRARDFAISYTYSGAIVIFSDRLGEAERAAAVDAFMDACVAAGWEVGVRGDGSGLTLTHPTGATSLGHGQPEAGPA